MASRRIAFDPLKMITDDNKGFDLSEARDLNSDDDHCFNLDLARLFSNRVGVIMRPPWGGAPSSPVEGMKEEDLARPQSPTSLPPAIDPAPESTDALVAKELYQLSLQDRNRLMEELHGVDDSTSGLAVYDELIGQSLETLAKELRLAPEKSAFVAARNRDPDYVCRKEFLIKFLRAESFNPKGSAKRILAFFEYKLELFGREKLTRDIGIRDLLDDPIDRTTLESGLFQPLVNRDRSGRIVIGKFQKHEFSPLVLENRLRVFFYMLMATTEHDIDQKRGIVLLVANQDGVVDRLDAWRNTTLLGALPVRVNGFHVIHNDPRITVLSSLAMLAMGPDYRARLRLHEGSILENMYSLDSFGISSTTVPLDSSTGEVKVELLNRWIEERLVVEGGSTTSSMDSISSAPLQRNCNILNPTEYDVVFGRGKNIQNFPGNIRLRQLIESHRSHYEGAKLLEKTMMADQLVQNIKSLPGRFLKKGMDEGWIEVADEVAREKISHAFRDRRRKIKQQET